MNISEVRDRLEEIPLEPGARALMFVQQEKCDTGKEAV